MSKYLRLFETTSQYEAYMGGGEKILPNVSLIEETNKVEYNPYIPPRNDIIIYNASEKLNRIWDDETATFGATIKSHTFENGVGTIEFNDNVTTLVCSAFENCSSLTSITIPNSITRIGSQVFYNCTNLTSITIPDSVTSIDENAFCNCSNLTSINIPNSVTDIGSAAFCYCQSLTSITIPDGVTSIGPGAFENCSSLVSVTVESTTPPTLKSEYGHYGQFDNNAGGRKIYVPSASVNTYKTATNWSTYASDIEAIPTE